MQSDKAIFSCGCTRLRTVTRKSILGFGKYSDITVGNLIDLKRYQELLSIYYRLDQIDFNEDVKNALGIRKEWQISKPGKDYKKAELYIPLCLSALIQADFDNGQALLLLKNKNATRKDRNRNLNRQVGLYQSKSFNQHANQKLRKNK